MFTSTKFKKGDMVSLKSDLTTMLEVDNVYLDKYYSLSLGSDTNERVVLSNGTVVDSTDLDFYLEPIKNLATKNNILNNEIVELKKVIESYNKNLEETKDKIFRKHEWFITSASNYYLNYTNLGNGSIVSVAPPTPKVKTLEERIEELENLVKNRKIIEKSKKSKK